MDMHSDLFRVKPANAAARAAPMDARLVWDTWRRIMSDDQLVAMMGPDGGDTAPAALSLEELAVLADYASTPQATMTNIGMFRRGLVRIARVALSRAPLSQHLLYMSGLDVDTVAEAFSQAHGYADDGPNFWRLASAFLAYLAELPEFAAPAHQDVFVLDQALAALALRLGLAAPDTWPNGNAARHAATAASAHGEHGAPSFVASPAAALASSRCDLTPWIENPYGYDPGEVLPRTPHHWLMYFGDADSAPEYAELNARSARLFTLLAKPHSAAQAAQALGGLSEAEALGVIGQLAQLGVVSAVNAAAAAAGPQREGETFETLEALADDDFVMLDPAVEMLDVERAEHRFLCHGHLEVGMAVPPGDGLADFIADLARQPVRVGTLRCGFDDQRLVETMLEALRRYGFLHVTQAQVPTLAELAQLRHAAARARHGALRHIIDCELGTEPAGAIAARVAAHGGAVELHLRCASLGRHGALLAELAELRQCGRLRLHHSVVKASELRCDAAVLRALRRLGADVLVEGLAWTAPAAPLAGLDALARAGVPLHVSFRPGPAFFDGALRARALDWAASVFACAIHLELDADALWPAGADEAHFGAVFDIVEAANDAFGDVRIASLPDDEVLLGHCAARTPQALSPLARRFRLAYLHWRLPLLKASEGDNTFSQTPQAEEKLVRLAEDLLPNHPELLRLPPGGIVVDVCGGNGRVARRLAPQAGADGLVISVEMLRCVTERARHFACAGGYTNVQFRTGLTQRLPLPDGMADAAVNEWTGAIWELGLGAAMLAEMTRVVRPGGRIAVTHRLVRLPLHRLGEPWIQFGDIYALMHAAFEQAGLVLVGERIWGQCAASLVGERASAWRKQYVPRVVNPLDITYTEDRDPGPHADICLTLIAERVQ